MRSDDIVWSAWKHAVNITQFVRPEPGFGLKMSDRKLIDRISDVATAGGKLTETDKIPETKTTVTQGSVIVYEFGNSVPYTSKLEALSEFSVDNIWTVALRNDMAKALNTACAEAFTGCQIKATPTGTTGSPTTTFDTDGTCSNAATRNLSMTDVKNVVDYMSETLYTPFYDGENYICIGPRSSLRCIFDDSDFVEAAKYGDPERLFAGEVGRIYKTRFIEDNQGFATTIGSYKGQCVFFGADAVAECVAINEEIRAKIPGDYGRDKGVAWYFLGGWAEVWNTATAGQAKIVHVTSA